MAIDINGTPEYTDADLLVLWRNALASVATGQSYSIGGRSLTRADVKECRDMIQWLESRIDAAANSDGGMTAYAVFNGPR